MHTLQRSSRAKYLGLEAQRGLKIESQQLLESTGKRQKSLGGIPTRSSRSAEASRKNGSSWAAMYTVAFVALPASDVEVCFRPRHGLTNVQYDYKVAQSV